MYLLELRRDADMVWATQANRGRVGTQHEFFSEEAFAIVVDEKMAKMTEDNRLRELFKRARRHVRDQQKKDASGQDLSPQSVAG
jgi:hypothetical protein